MIVSNRPRLDIIYKSRNENSSYDLRVKDEKLLKNKLSEKTLEYKRIEIKRRKRVL